MMWWCWIRSKFWRHFHSNCQNRKLASYAWVPERYRSYKRIRFCTVSSLWASLFKAILDDDKRRNCWGNEFRKQHYFVIKLFSPLLVLDVPVVTTSLSFRCQLRVWLLNAGVEVKLIPSMELLKNIKLVFARWSQRGSWFAIVRHFLQVRFDEVCINRFVSARWLVSIVSQLHYRKLEHIREHCPGLGLTCVLKSPSLHPSSSQVLCGDPTIFLAFPTWVSAYFEKRKLKWLVFDPRFESFRWWEMIWLDILKLLVDGCCGSAERSFFGGGTHGQFVGSGVVGC